MQQSNENSSEESFHNTVDVKHNNTTRSGGVAGTKDDSYENNEHQQHTKKNSSFLESMTFTSVTTSCDCDECFFDDADGKRRYVPIPQTISNAIQNHKRAKRTDFPVKRSQVRTLIERSDKLRNIAIWELTMPSLAEPLVEFGNPLVYRIIWIKRLPKRLRIKQIGSGIIGSKNEEQGRKELNWMENDVLFVSSTDQKAIGYSIEPIPFDNDTGDADDEVSCASLPGPAVLYIAKIPAEHLHKDEILIPIAFDTGSPLASFEIVRRICHRAVQLRDMHAMKGDSIPLDTADQILFRDCVTAISNRSQDRFLFACVS